MHVCMHACMHTYIHTNKPYILTYIQTNKFMNTHQWVIQQLLQTLGWERERERDTTTDINESYSNYYRHNDWRCEREPYKRDCILLYDSLMCTTTDTTTCADEGQKRREQRSFSRQRDRCKKRQKGPKRCETKGAGHGVCVWMCLRACVYSWSFALTCACACACACVCVCVCVYVYVYVCICVYASAFFLSVSMSVFVSSSVSASVSVCLNLISCSYTYVTTYTYKYYICAYMRIYI